MALSGFDKDYYLAAKLAALQATETEWVGKDTAFLETVLTAYGFTAESHYTAYGRDEGLQPNAYFNEAEYKLAKATAMFDAGGYWSIEDAQTDFEAKWPWDAYHHYLAYGSAEGVNPSNDFDESSYLASKLAALQADSSTEAEWADKTVDDVQSAFTDAGLSVLGHYIAYGKDEGIAVTPVPTDEQVDVAAAVSVVGETFTLTTGVDTFTGTVDDDLFIALDEDDITDTLTLGDNIDGGAGTDTLKIFSDNDDLTLAVLQVSNVENLLVINAHEDWDEFDVASRDFDEITVDVGGLESGGLDVDNVNASTAFTLTNIFADNETNYIYFNTDNTSTVGTTTVTISDVDMSDDEEYFEVYAGFTAADTINTAVNLSNINDYEEYEDGGYYHYLDTGTATGVAVNATFNVENVLSADEFDVEFYVYQDGDSVNNVTVNLTNTDNVYFWMYLDDDGNGTSSEDVVTLNLDGVANSNGCAEFYTTDAETFNVNVLSDSELEYIGDYYNGDSSSMGDMVVNLNAAADLTVGFWDFNDDSGITENTTFNIIGSGNVTIEDLDDGSSNLMVVASTATGNISLDDLRSEVVSVTTGSGDDSITVGSYETTVSTGAGDDKVDMAGYDYGHADAETLDGGADTDTIVIDDGLLLDADSAANISNFEILDFTSGTGTYDMDVETSLKDVSASTSIAAPVTIDNVAGDVALTLNKFVDTDAITLVLKDGTGTSDALALNLNAIDADTDQTAVGETDAVIVAAEYETINLTSNATTASEESAPGADDALTAADYTNTVDLDAVDMTDLVISGNAMAAVTFTDATALTFVDASASEAGVDVNVFDALMLPAAGVTFKGSDAADTYYSANGGDTIQGNGGADTLTLNDGAVLSGGDDTIRYVSATDSQLTLVDTDDPADGEADVMEDFDVIDNFGAEGTDIIELSSLLGLATGDARADMLQKGAIGGITAADMEDFIGDGVDFFDTGVVDRATAFADDGTNGYLFIDANSDGDFTQADDMVINLAGVTSLAITDISFG